MDTIRAVLQMSRDGSAAGEHGRAGAAYLETLSPGLSEVVFNAIHVSQANGMHPDSDFATATRLAAAIDRHAADRLPNHDSMASLRSVMTDYLLQEAAGARLEANGLRDPLNHAADPESARSTLRASETLHRNGLKSHVIFDRASARDIEAMAAGRYDRIEMDHTRFAVSSQLRLSAKAMSLETVEPAASRTGIRNPAVDALKGRLAQDARAAAIARLSKGPETVKPVRSKGPEVASPVLGFGRKGVAER